MYRTHIKPEHQDVSIHLPVDYVGKNIEVMVYISEEKNESPQKKMSDYRGILSDEKYQDLKRQTANARKEWNRKY